MEDGTRSVRGRDCGVEVSIRSRISETDGRRGRYWGDEDCSRDRGSRGQGGVSFRISNTGRRALRECARSHGGHAESGRGQRWGQAPRHWNRVDGAGESVHRRNRRRELLSPLARAKPSQGFGEEIRRVRRNGKRCRCRRLGRSRVGIGKE